MTETIANSDLHSISAVPLHDLGIESATPLRGVFSPLYDSSVVSRFMTDLYANQDAADAQVRSLDGLHQYYKELLHKHLINSGRIENPEAPLRILEIGCGFGAATLPLLELFPNAHVYASELSLSMLTALNRNLKGTAFEKRCTLLQLNAEELQFKEASFDLIVGAAILHHLFEPQKTIQRAGRILRPGGHAIFFEPYEAGMAVVSLIYQMILRDPRRFLLARPFYHYLRYTVDGWKNITTKPKDAPFFHGIDDKWFFSRSFIEGHAKSAAFSQISIRSICETATPYRDLIKTHIAGNGFASNAPAWIWELVDQVEASMSPILKQELATDVVVTLKR